MSAQSETQSRRAAPRLRLCLPGKFLAVDGNHRCVVTNVSRTGMLIQIDEPLAAGREGYVRSGPIDHFVTVTRKGKSSNALEFDNPLTDTFVHDLRIFYENYAHFEAQDLQRNAKLWINGGGMGRI